MAQAATQTRAVAAAALKESTRVLDKYKQTQNPSKRLLQSKLDKTLADKQELIQRHYIYAEKNNVDPDDESKINWLATRVSTIPLALTTSTVCSSAKLAVPKKISMRLRA